MRGYSLFEIIIVVAIVAILLAISVTAYSAFLDRQRLNKAAEEVVTIIQKARAMTVSSYDATGGITTFGRQYCVQIFDNDDPVSGSADNNKIKLNQDSTGSLIEYYVVGEGIYIQSFSIDPPANNGEICFRRLSGDAFVHPPAPADPSSTVNLNLATITLKSQSSGKTRAVTVSPTGVVQAQ